jgi:cell shape-determining protein MreC
VSTAASSVGAAVGAGAKSKAQELLDEKKELLRLKKEIREKKALEKKLADLEQEAKMK